MDKKVVDFCNELRPRCASKYLLCLSDGIDRDCDSSGGDSMSWWL